MFEPLKKLGRLGYVSCALLFAVGCASGMAGDDAESAPEEVLDPGPSMEAVLAEWQGALAGSMSEDERRSVVTLLTANGVPEEEIGFRGRMVTRGGDGHWFADEILEATDSEGLVEKGLVFRNADTTPISGTNYQLCYAPGALYQTECPMRPVDLANASGANLSWKRPNVIDYFIIATPGMPASFTGANGILTKAANLIANGVASGTGDCLNNPNGLFSVQTLASYNNQAANVKAHYHELYVFPSDNICPGGGCATFPRNQSTDAGTRLAFGPGIALPTSLPNDPYGVGIAVHELLHAMGFAHSDEDPSITFKIPGTPDVCAPHSNSSNPPNECELDSAGLSNGSIMHSGLNEFGWDDWIDNATGATKIPPGDVNMIKKLYAGSCTFDSNFRTVTPCGPNGILGHTGGYCCAGPCAVCGGPGCSGSPGSADRCCSGNIGTANKPCGPFDPPCVIR